MALFLNESMMDEAPVVGTIEEAYAGLLESAMDMHELTEAMLQGDFILHEQVRVLSEEEAKTKQANFLSKAAAKVIEIIKKIRDHIVAAFNKIGNWFKGILDKLRSKKAEDLEVPADTVEPLVDAVTKTEAWRNAVIEKATGAASATKEKVKSLKNSALEAVKKFKLKLKTSREAKKTEKVKVNKLGKVVKVALGLGAATMVVKKGTEAAVKRAEAGKAKADKGETTEAGSDISTAREDASAINQACSALASLVSSAGSFFKPAPAAAE